MPRKVFTAGEVLAAADVNSFLMDQTVMTFAGTAARGSAIGTATEGMVTWLNDQNALQVYDGTQWNGLAASDNNAVLNSAFEIWQRGTSFAVPSSNNTSYTADRWSAFRAATGSTVSRQVTNDTTNLPNIQYGIRLQRDSGNSATNGITLVQHFETASSIPFAGKVVTVSFYARKGANYSNATSIIDVNLATGTGVDQNIWAGLTGRANPINESKTVTSTWTRFDVTGTVATTATQIVLNFSIPSFVGTASTNDWVEITGVQLEVGPTANVFRRNANSLQGELAACQRYYYRSGGDNNSQYHATGAAISTTATRFAIMPPVTMRVKPTSIEFGTLATYDAGAASIIAVTNVTLDVSTKNLNTVAATVASGLTVQRPLFLISNSSADGFIALNAEL
jgi:hypothetical protein